MGTVASASPEAEADFKTAQKLVKRKEFKRALPFFNHAIKLDPNVAKFYAERGSLLLGLEEREQALNDLSKALKLDPSLCETFADRARCHYELGDYQAAVDDISHAINLDHDKIGRAFKIRDRATFYIELGQLKKALDDVRTSLSLFPDYYTYFIRAGIYEKQKQYKSAVEDYTSGLKIIKPDATDVEFWYENRARAYDKLGQADLAAKDRIKSRGYSKKDPYYDFLPPDDPHRTNPQPVPEKQR
jgi:tetratricopeptide (TPR) repeat protein